MDPFTKGEVTRSLSLVTSDGKIFKVTEAYTAHQWQLLLNLRALLDYLGIGAGGTWDTKQTARAIMQHIDEFRDVLGPRERPKRVKD